MSESTKAILAVKNLDISFKTNAGIVHAIRGVTFDMEKGETVAIVGESGSGKSVSCKAIMGLLDSNATVNSGEIWYTYTDESGQTQKVDLLKMPIKQLRGFERVTIARGQKKAVSITIPKKELRYWDEQKHGFVTPSGQYTIMVGSSSQRIHLQSHITL